MRKVITAMLLLTGLLAVAQRSDKKNCYKVVKASDTVVYNMVWKDSTENLKWTLGMIVTNGMKLTCTNGWDTIYSQKSYVVYQNKLYSIKPELIMTLTPIRNESN